MITPNTIHVKPDQLSDGLHLLKEIQRLQAENARDLRTVADRLELIKAMRAKLSEPKMLFI